MTEDYELKPWLQFYPHTPGKIACDETSDGRVTMLTSLFFFAMGIYIYTQVEFENPTDDIFLYALVGIGPLIGCICLLTGVRAMIRTRKFGISTVTIKDERGVVGKTLTGTIQNTVEVRPNGAYAFSLQCRERYYVETKNGSSSRHRILWDTKLEVPSATASSVAGIPFSIQIPAGVRQSNPSPGSGEIQWVLSVTAPTPGVNYKASFIVPVYRSL